MLRDAHGVQGHVGFQPPAETSAYQMIVDRYLVDG
jgi:hypothetical protein